MGEQDKRKVKAPFITTLVTPKTKKRNRNSQIPENETLTRYNI